MRKFELKKVSGSPCRHVPSEGNPYAGMYCLIAGLRLPMVSDECLYLPKVNMRNLVEQAEGSFPCRFTEESGGELDVAVTREGFLLRLEQLDRVRLEAFHAYLLTRYEIPSIPFDVICRKADDALPEVAMLRVIPWQLSGEELLRAMEDSSTPSPDQNEERLLACVNSQRCVSVSEFAEESLMLAAELSAKTGKKSRKRGSQSSRQQVSQVRPVTDRQVRLCALTAMEARMEREPSRNGGGGGGAGGQLTLGKLCEEKTLLPVRAVDLKKVACLHERLPNFSTVIEMIQRKFEAQMLCGSAMRLPPILLLGEAGVGKSYFCRLLAEALGMNFECVPVAGSSQELQITGLSKSWGGAGPSRFAEIMGASVIANPLIMVDEIDKSSDIKVQNALLQIFEPETAARWVDQYVEVPLDLSHAMFVATANCLDDLSPVLLSRFEVFEIGQPSAAQWAQVFNSIYGDEKNRLQQMDLFSRQLPASFVEHLQQQAVTPRAARRLLVHAMEQAVIRTHRAGRLGQGRIRLQLADLPVRHAPESNRRMGFV